MSRADKLQNKHKGNAINRKDTPTLKAINECKVAFDTANVPQTRRWTSPLNGGWLKNYSFQPYYEALPEEQRPTVMQSDHYKQARLVELEKQRAYIERYYPEVLEEYKTVQEVIRKLSE